MLRRPAILVLFLFLVFLGAGLVLNQRFQKISRPVFTDVSGFINQTSWPAGWRNSGLNISASGGRGPASGWMKWIQRPTMENTASFAFHNSRTSQEAVIHVTTTDREITKVKFEPPVKDLKDHFYAKFPALLPYDADAKP